MIRFLGFYALALLAAMVTGGLLALDQLLAALITAGTTGATLALQFVVARS